MKIFNTSTDLKQSSLKEGQIVETKGWISLGDRSAARYLIKTPVDFGGTPDEIANLSLTNGNVAALLLSGDYIKLSELGCSSDNPDNSTAIQHAVNNYKFILVDVDYKVTQPIYINGSDIWIVGVAGSRLWTDQDNHMFLFQQVERCVFKNFKIENTLVENGSAPFFTDVSGYGVLCDFISLEMKGWAQGPSIAGDTDFAKYLSYTDGTYTHTVTRDTGKTINLNRYINCVIGDSLRSTKLGSGGNPCIYLLGSFNLVSGCTLKNSIGPGVLGGDDSIIVGNTIVNMVFESGIYTGGGGIQRLHAYNNYIENTQVDGIAFNNAKDCVASGNRLKNVQNAAFRTQNQVENITITDNKVEIDNGIHFFRGYISGTGNGAKNIQIKDNEILCSQPAKGNLFYVYDVQSGSTNHENIIIKSNTIRGYDSTSLVSSFYGPYALCQFNNSTTNGVFEDNKCYEIADIPADFTGRMMLFNGVDVVRDNYIKFNSGTVYDGKLKTGWARFDVTTGGVIIGYKKKGLIIGVAKDTDVGMYKFTTSEPIAPNDITINVWGTNAPATVQVYVPTSGTSTTSEVANQFQFRFYDISGNAYDPQSDCNVRISVTRREDGYF